MRLCGRIPFLIPLKDGKPNGSGVLHSTNGKRTSIDFSEIKNLLFKKLEEPVDIVWEGSVFVFPGESKSLNSSKISSRFNKEHALGQLLRELGVDLLETVVGIQPSLLGRACYFGDLQVLEYSVRLYAKKASS